MSEQNGCVVLYFYPPNWELLHTMTVIVKMLQKRISFKIVSAIGISGIPQVIQSVKNVVIHVSKGGSIRRDAEVLLSNKKGKTEKNHFH